MTLLRGELPKRFPGIEFFFQPADIVTQILNFGLPAAIDVQFTGTNVRGQRGARRRADASRSGRFPGAVDAHVHQRLDSPAVNLQMDRTRLQQIGLSAANVGQNVLISLVGQLADRAGVLAQPAERRRLQHRGADAAVPASTRSTRCSTCRSAAAPAPPAASGSTQLLGNLVEATPGRAAGGGVALQHPAGDRRLRQRAGHRPGERRRARCRRWSTRCGRSCRAAARW